MLMKCPVCGGHMLEDAAIEIPEGDVTHRYCSLRCADAVDPGLTRELPSWALPPSLKRILVAVDGSGPATRAVARAAALALDSGAEVELIHAVDEKWLRRLEVGEAGESARTRGVALDQVGEVLQQEADAQLAHCERICREVGVKCTSRVEKETPLQAILAAAKSADLLVIGRRGLDAFSEVAVGSTAMQTIALATCPVLVVH